MVTVTDISEQKRVEEQLRERQREIDADLSTAALIQQSLAPHNLAWKDLAVEAYYSPARTIGGDFGIVLPSRRRISKPHPVRRVGPWCRVGSDGQPHLL